MTANNILRSEETYSQFSLICALDFSDLLAAFVELKSGHGLNAASSCSLLIRIDINLGKDNRGKFFLHFFVNRRNHFAGPAPRVAVKSMMTKGCGKELKLWYNEMRGWGLRAAEAIVDWYS